MFMRRHKFFETEQEHEETQAERRVFIQEANSHLAPFKQALLDNDMSWHEEAVFVGVWGILQQQLKGCSELHPPLLPRPQESLELIQTLEVGDDLPDREGLLNIFTPVVFGDRKLADRLLDAWEESMRLLEIKNREIKERGNSCD